MNLLVKTGKIEAESATVLVLWRYEDEKMRLGEMASIDRLLGGQIHRAISSEEFTGKQNQLLLLHPQGNLNLKRVLVVGLGKRKDFSLENLRRAAGTMARHVREISLQSMTVDLPRGSKNRSAREIAQALVEGCLLGLYEFNSHRTERKDPHKPLNEIIFIASRRSESKQVSQGIRMGQIVAEATCFARDLVNHPSNVMTPSKLSEEARSLARRFGLRVKVIDRAEAKRMGMGAFLGIAQGSNEPPKFIVLEYWVRRSINRPVVLVGKSITFDSGGISLKPADRMEQMKSDMAGGAAVLGTMMAVAAMKLPLPVVGILPATENMPGGTAVKPGDVVKAYSGKTIEVINTDAEGRMVLADGISYAARYKPSCILDLATLTGAVVVALGHHAIGVLGNSPRLIRGLLEAGDRTGERLWELPLWDVYSDQIKSDIADMKNVGGRAAGTITAAAFLKKFVGDHEWAHLDIAGTAWSDENRPTGPKGATGVGVRLLIDFLSTFRPSSGSLGSFRSAGSQRKRV